MGIVSTSYEIGSVVALLSCGLIVRAGFGWRALFVVNPILFLAVGLSATYALRSDADRANAAPAADRIREIGRRIGWLSRRRSFWIALALSFLLTFVRTGFLTWTPTFLAEVTAKEGGSVSGAILKSAIFPAMGVLGALLAGRASDRFGPGRRAPVIAGSLLFLVGSVVTLGHAGFDDTTFVLVCIAASGFFLLGAYSLVGGAVALDVGETRAASTAAGLIDAAGYVGGSLAGVLLGTVAERRGWSSVFDALAAAAFAGAVVAGVWGLAPALAVRSKAAL
jgi:sugar phosphate permease